MRTWTISVLACCGWVCSIGCERTGEPPPRSNAAFEAGEASLVPMRVPSRSWDKSILAAAATEEEVNAPKPGAGAAQPIAIDDSTPEGIVQTYAQMMSAGQLQQIPDIVVPEQQEITRELMAAVVPAMAAMRELQAAWKERFPDHAFNMSGPSPLLMGGMPTTVVSVETIGDDSAEATVQTEGVPEPEKLELKKIDGAWRIRDPKAPQPEQMEMVRGMLGALPQLAEAMRGVAGRIREGEFTEAAAAEQALGEAAQQAMAGAMKGFAESMGEALKQGMQDALGSQQTPQPEAAEQPPREEPRTEPQAEPQPQPRGRSNDNGGELDGVYTGPNQLRNR